MIVSALLLCLVIFRWGYLFINKWVVVALNVLVLILCVGIYFQVRRFARIVMLVLFGCWLFTVAQVVMLCYFNPHNTLLMRVRSYENSECKQQPIQYVELDKISPFLIHAADVGEDGGLFMYHRGFVVNRLVKCCLNNEAGNPIQGGSTITQQAAKNCFLPPCRTILRKLVEAHYTILMELFLGKRRIMECYLNVVEFGCGIYGCEVASQYYFHHPASQLTQSEAVMLIASLPSPCQSNPIHPTSEYNARFNAIMGWMEEIPMTKINNKHEDLDPELLVRNGRSTWFFCKWLLKHKLIRLFGITEPVSNDAVSTTNTSNSFS
jgi:monofunctional biosynthetic peptidoglycan transglycosylase